MDIHTVCAFCGVALVRRKQSDKANVQIHFCNMACKAEYQKLAKPVSKEWLEDHYINQHLDCVQIGRLVQRDPKSVWNWLRDLGIPTRGRGTVGTGFQKGNISPTTGQHRPESVKQALREARRKKPTLPHLCGGNHYLKGKRGPEVHSWKGGCTPERQAAYSSEKWKAAIKVVWQRDNATCQRCGLDHRIINREAVKFAIHHITTFANRELRYEPDNLILLCPPCHRWVHSRENTEREFRSDG